MASVKKTLIEKRWAFAAIILGVLVGFLSAYLCIIWHLVIFGFNIMYIVSPLLAGVVETFIARRKYGKSTGAISALLTFLLINIYGWVLPGIFVDPTKEPATLSFITIIAIALTIQAAFPILVNYILFVVVVGTFTRLIGFLVNIPSKIIQAKPPETERKNEITKQDDEIFLDELTIPIVSVPDVSGGKIKRYLGLVIGEAVAEEKESEGRFSKILKIIQPIKLDDMNLGKARKVALSKMLEKAESMGANAVVEVLIDYVSMGGLQGSATIITATGTAVIVQETSNLEEKVSGGGSMPGTGEKINVSGVSAKVSGGSESISVMDEEIEGEVSDTIEEEVTDTIEGEVSDAVSKDDLSNQIGQLMNEKSDHLIEDGELATKNDLEELEKRYSRVSRDVDELDKRFEEDREYTNKKINRIEDRIEKLETPEEYPRDNQEIST